jgi:hypothetical protein
MLIKEGNQDIQNLISNIDKNAEIIRKNKYLKDYPEIEKDILELYQSIVLPFIENYANADIDIEPDIENEIRDGLLLLLNDLIIIIESSQ